MPPLVYVPAISPELAFCSRKWAIINDVLERENQRPIVEITEAVYERAWTHADVLFRRLEDAVTDGASGRLRPNWVNTNRGSNWASWARLFLPRGRTRIGSIGLWLGYDATALRLFGWVWPRWGGLDGRRELVRVCRLKGVDACLPYEDPKKYPGMTQDDGVLWLDRQLSTRMPLESLAGIVKARSKAFCRVAKPVLARLAD